ncbi:MAG TPA: hypothetical protein VH413_09465 [Verrucomicrobiae bacterium]|nr:hypothetical protein [Verrucomicrobiae bacterium]
MISFSSTSCPARPFYHSLVTIIMFGLAVATFTQPVRADMIELTNGDHYRGVVISMTQTNMEFLSEIQGRVTLPRNKIAQITLNEVITKSVVVTKPPVTNGTLVAAPLILSGASTAAPVRHDAAPGNQADAVVQQMRQQGVDPRLIDQVQEQIFGKSSPAAAQKFNEMIGGLQSGSMSIRDLRNQAQSAINQINSAKKEFGSDAGDMLDGYLTILQNFVRDADTDAANTITPSPPTAAVSTK